MIKNIVFSSKGLKNFPRLGIWEPKGLQLMANSRNNYELQLAKKRVYKGRWGEYKYTPSESYVRAISKFKTGNSFHRILWGVKI